MGLWRNGNASDYESEDCRFDPCQARLFLRRVRDRERKGEEKIRGRSKGEEEHKVREQRD